MSDKDTAPTIEFASDTPRTKDLPLEHPLTVNGEELKKITVRRLLAREVKQLQDKADGVSFNLEAMIPTFTDQPAEVLEVLDQDDWLELVVMVTDFLPRRLREALEQVEAEYFAAEESSQSSPSGSTGGPKSS